MTAVHMDLLWPALLALTLYTLNLPLIALLPAMLLLHRVMARLKARPLETATDLNVIIVGAGVSGLCMGKKLKEEGAKFTILEKSPRLGGTWWENTYPGCGCDVPSHLYSFSFLPNPDWSRVYSGQEGRLTRGGRERWEGEKGGERGGRKLWAGRQVGERGR